MQSGYSDGLLGEFYSAFARTRCIIEQTFGVMKARFEVLKGPMRFRDPVVSGTVIMAVGMLHNFIYATRRDEEIDDNLLEVEEENAVEPEEPEEQLDDNVARVRLQKMLEYYRQAHNL